MARAELDVDEVAAALQLSVSLLLRQMRQAPSESELATPESSALARLDRGGPATASALAKLEQISPQSMGATLSALEARGYLTRRLDADDGRRIVLSITDAGLQALRAKRSQRTKIMAAALSHGFTQAELAKLQAAAPLIERLAQKI